MTYQTYEDSLSSGAPVELYELIQGVTRWNFCSAANSITYLGQVFEPSTITRDRIKQTSDIFKDSLKLTFPRSDSFASQFLGFAPEEVTTVTIFRGHTNDTDGEFIVYWKGRVVGAKTSGNKIEIECESVFTSIRRPGLRARFEYACRHTLYGSGCGVNRELYKHVGTVLSISGGLEITVSGASSEADGFYTGGIFVSAEGSARFITSHVGDVVTISRTISDLVGSQSATIYPGCDHLTGTCNTKFNNLDNHGGFPWIPSRNPFNGSSIV